VSGIFVCSHERQISSAKQTVYDVNTSLLVISCAGKTRSRDDDVIVSVAVDVTGDQVPGHYVTQNVVLFLSYKSWIMREMHT